MMYLHGKNIHKDSEPIHTRGTVLKISGYNKSENLKKGGTLY